MKAQIVVGLFQSSGIAEDACNRLRTEGVPDTAISFKILREISRVPMAREAELAPLSVDPMIWGDVRDTYDSYIHNGETVVLVRVTTDAEVELASDVLRMFEPLVVELLMLQTTPAARIRATSSAE